jgi:hypothetical protein
MSSNFFCLISPAKMITMTTMTTTTTMTTLTTPALRLCRVLEPGQGFAKVVGAF